MKREILKNHKGEPLTSEIFNRQKALSRRFSFDDWAFLCGNGRFLDATLESEEAAIAAAQDILQPVI